MKTRFSREITAHTIIDDEERKEDIANLVNYALPKGMFELVGDDTIAWSDGKRSMSPISGRKRKNLPS